jgi:hypothetical protein
MEPILGQPKQRSLPLSRPPSSMKMRKKNPLENSTTSLKETEQPKNMLMNFDSQSAKLDYQQTTT